MVLYLQKEMLTKLKMLQSLPHSVLPKNKEKNPKPPRVMKYFYFVFLNGIHVFRKIITGIFLFLVFVVFCFLIVALYFLVRRGQQ